MIFFDSFGRGEGGPPYAENQLHGHVAKSMARPWVVVGRVTHWWNGA